MRSNCIGAGVCAVCLNGISSAQSTFRTLGPETRYGASVVSGDGDVVARRTTLSVFRWSESLGFESLGQPPAPYDQEPSVTGISGNGSVIVGWAADMSQKQYPGAAFYWTIETGIQRLGPTLGLAGGRAYGVSADGARIAGHWTFSAKESGTYRFTQDSGFELLTQQMAPLAMSGDGEVVVGAARSPARWSASHGTELLGDLPGGDVWGYASDVSPDGSVVIGGSQSALNNPPEEYEAFRWTRNFGIVGLGALPTEEGIYRWSHAHGLSSNGSVIVGSSIVSSSPYRLRAFIWRPESGMQRLDEVLREEFSLGAQMEGWSLWEATAISDDGRTIVGSAVHDDGHGEAFVVRLEDHCPADFNRDSRINSQDFFDFLHAFFVDAAGADFNRDSAVNSQDFFDYLAAFFGVCTQ